MTRASFLLFALSSLVVSSCKSVSLGGNEQDAGDQPAGGTTGSSSRTTGTGGNGGTEALDAAILGGQGGSTSANAPCKGLEIPDFDCGYGTPTYICVARGSGWVWDFTCPERPTDGGLPDTRPPVDSASCPGSNPAARSCRTTTSDCIPSSCACGSNGTWTCTTDCRSYPLCGVDAGSDTTIFTGCYPAKAAQALATAGITTVGEAENSMETLPENLSAGANWGVKDIECREGGYDLSPLAGKSVCLVSFATTSLCQQLPATAWVVMSDGIVRCIYQSAALNPGVYSVHDETCSSPDAAVPSCPGTNPAARTCRSSSSDCIPSGCTCGSDGQWTCTADCRTYPLCGDGGAADSAVTCSGERIDTTQATTAFAQSMRQLKPGLNPKTTFGVEEKTVANLWDTLQAQLFFGKMYAEDGTVWQEVAFLYHGCSVTLATTETWFGLIESGAVMDGAFYYSWRWGSGLSRTVLSKLRPDGTSLLMTTSPEYLNEDLVLVPESGRLAVYRAVVYWAKFNEWESRDPKPVGYLKDLGDRLAVVDENGKEWTP